MSVNYANVCEQVAWVIAIITLREKCPNMEFFLVRIFLYFPVYIHIFLYLRSKYPYSVRILLTFFSAPPWEMTLLERKSWQKRISKQNKTRRKRHIRFIVIKVLFSREINRVNNDLWIPKWSSSLSHITHMKLVKCFVGPTRFIW